jgi:amino acid transporter
MKKIMFAVLIVVLALGVFASVASAQTVQTTQQNMGLLHDYMEKALAEKLGIPLATVEAQFDAGKTIYQIALDNGIAEADLPAFMLEVRTTAINAELSAGVITQAQADRMLQSGGYGMGQGMRRGGTGAGTCGGTGIPAGTGMQHGGHWQQVNP